MAATEALITIIWEENGERRSYPLPEPTSYSAATSTMIDSGTSVSGKVLGSVVRSDVAQISISWNHMEAPVWSKIAQLFKDEPYKRIRFYDQTADDWVEREMQVSDRSAGMWRRDENGKVLGWSGCSLQFTEV